MRFVGVVRLVLLVGLLGLWEVGARTGHVDPFSFSSPKLVRERLADLFGEGTIWPHIEATGRKSGWGWGPGSWPGWCSGS